MFQLLLTGNHLEVEELLKLMLEGQICDGDLVNKDWSLSEMSDSNEINSDSLSQISTSTDYIIFASISLIVGTRYQHQQGSDSKFTDWFSS